MIPHNDSRCTGCTACVHVCPSGAIKMQYNSEGFLYPFIDKDKCTKCNKCNKVCQIFGIKRFKTPSVCYASWSKDEEARLRSASGAIFYELAKKTLLQKGIVCGAAFVNNFGVQHILIKEEKELSRLQGSKYLQSDLTDCFIQIKDFLLQGRKVLFSGTGCQVAGLKKYLQRDYENLLTVDLVCHGVPSPGVFKVYLAELKEKYGDFDSVSFRDKENGWNWDFYFTLKRKDKTILRDVVGNDIYLTAFLRHYILRRSCHVCEFATASRCADITLADFWNIKSYRQELDDGKGTSLLLIHSRIGENAIEEIRNNLACLEKCNIQQAIKSNANLVRPSAPHANRQKFFDYFEKTNTVSEWFDKEFNRVGILNFHFANNIGAVLVAYSLVKVVNSLGYHAEIINYRPSGKPEDNKFEDFRRQYIPQSSIYSSVSDLNKTKYRRIIVGSDQVWKLGNTEMFMLGWASGYRSFTAYAASFGDSQYAGSIDEKYAETLLKRFDSISVREDSGVNICNKNFKVHAQHVLDPTFLLPVSDYEQIIEDEKNKIKIHGKYIFVACYSNENNHILNHEKTFFTNYSEYQIVDLWKLKNPSIGQLLFLIKNANYIVTDSFHITVFSVIFNKEFISLVPVGFNGQDRIPSLLYGFGLKDRIRNNLMSVDNSCFSSKIEYTKVNRIISKKREFSIDFLKNALEKNILYKNGVKSTDRGNDKEFWKEFLLEKNSSIPFFLKPMRDFKQNYFLFFINKVDGAVHYELTKPIDGAMKIALHFENKNIVGDVKKIERIKYIAERLKSFGFEYVSSADMIGIRKVIQLDNFEESFAILVYTSYFEVLKVMGVVPEEEIRFFQKYLTSLSLEK